MDSLLSSLKTERIGKKIYRTRDEAKAEVFDYIERFYNHVRRHSTIGYLSPVEFERIGGLSYTEPVEGQWKYIWIKTHISFKRPEKM
jgi:hypothetical protein